MTVPLSVPKQTGMFGKDKRQETFNSLKQKQVSVQQKI
jgi:hypothetical protein